MNTIRTTTFIIVFVITICAVQIFKLSNVFQPSASYTLKKYIIYNVTNDHKFPFSIKVSKFCSNSPDLEILIVVHSAIKNRHKRDIIRQTYGNKKWGQYLNSRILFFLGKSHSREENRNVIMEALYHGDVVVQDFHDSYRNLTYKAMSWLQWVSEYCHEPSYVLKLDDDMLVNIFALKELLKWTEENGDETRENLFCNLRVKEPVLRNKNKWYVSKKEYSPDFYPKYCPGTAVLFDRTIIDQLHAASYSAPFFWIDDVFFTGILREQIDAKIVNIKHLFGSLKNDKNVFELISKDETRISRWNEIIGSHNFTTPSKVVD